MFDLRWARRDQWSQQPAVPAPSASAFHRGDVEKVLNLVWREHCVECAAPECYRTCALYEARADGHCARFKYGIYPNSDLAGQFNFGADIFFRRWGKLEATLGPATAGIPLLPHPVQTGLSRLPLWMQNRSAFVRRAFPSGSLDFDAFIVECHNPSSDTVPLILSHDVYDGDRQHTRLRESFDLQPGLNSFSVPFSRFDLADASGYLRLYLGNASAEARLVFTWLDFVTFRPGRRPAMPGAHAGVPAAKVKCVAWDLDNTVWRGTFIETTDPSTLTLMPGVAECIRALDARGIIQTVVSRNDRNEVWPTLERLGLAEYFVYPAINWGQKSENLKQVAERINIGLDTFALIDDSPQQRHEIGLALPQVRVYAETEIPTLINRPEVDVPITAASATRRLSYLASMHRDEVQASFGDDYENFLRACEIRLRFFEPRSDADLLRCWELVQRTNQLNLSGRRYTLDEFKAHMRDAGTRGFAVHYQDKFGDYGIVGFGSLNLAAPALEDFVLSCRVAQQRVEHAFLDWVADALHRRGAPVLHASLVKTARNGPLRQVFSDLHFDVTGDGDRVEMTLDLSRPRNVTPLATITADASAFTS